MKLHGCCCCCSRLRGGQPGEAGWRGGGGEDEKGGGASWEAHTAAHTHTQMHATGVRGRPRLLAPSPVGWPGLGPPPPRPAARCLPLFVLPGALWSCSFPAALSAA